ncbi:F55 [Hirschfeldia incana]|nr:F55 [Hirschfeldia incana]
MGCSPSKLDGLPAVSLCRDRCNSLEETLRRSYSLADAHSAYLLSLNTVGPSLHRFFDQAVESPPPDIDSTAETSSPESSSPTHSVNSSSSDSDLPPKFDSDCEDDGNRGNDCHLFRYHTNHEPFRSYESGVNTPPPPPPSNNAWDFINFFESYEFPYCTNLKDKETTRCLDEDKSKKKAPISKNDEKIRTEEDKCVLKISEKNKKKRKPEITGEPKDQNVSSDFSEVTKQWQEMFKKASEAGSEVSKMLDTSRFRYHQKTSVYQASSNVLYAKKMAPVEDFGSNFSNLSSTLKKLFMWEKKLYQEVKAEEKLRTSHMKRCKELRRLEGKSTDVNKLESIRSSIQCLSTRITVSIQMIDNICLMINKLRDEELWSQIKELIHRFSEMWRSMLECHSRQSRVMAEAKKLDKMTFKENLDVSQLELAMELKLELRNWSQSLSNWIDAQAQYVKALNSWLMRCLKQEPQEPTPDLSEEPPLFGAVNSWSQSLERSDGEKEFTEAVYKLLMQVSRQVEKRRMELVEQRNVNGGDKDVERKLVMLEKEEQRMQRKMKTVPSVEFVGSLNLKANMEQIFKCVEKLSTNLKQTYEEVDLMCT